MEQTLLKKRKKKLERLDDKHDPIQIEHLVPIPKNKIHILDSRHEATTIQKVYSVFKFHKEHDTQCIPLKTEENEVSANIFWYYCVIL